MYECTALDDRVLELHGRCCGLVADSTDTFGSLKDRFRGYYFVVLSPEK
jgi:hypothetical protein